MVEQLSRSNLFLNNKERIILFVLLPLYLCFKCSELSVVLNYKHSLYYIEWKTNANLCYLNSHQHWHWMPSSSYTEILLPWPYHRIYSLGRYLVIFLFNLSTLSYSPLCPVIIKKKLYAFFCIWIFQQKVSLP